MDDFGRQRRLTTVIIIGLLYFTVGAASIVLAGVAATSQMVSFWRLSAFVICGVVFAAHIAYEHFRLRSRARVTAWQTSVAVAIGGFALALAANLHDLGSAAGYRPRMLIALVAWPLITAVPAFIAALVVAAGLGMKRRRPVGRGSLLVLGLLFVQGLSAFPSRAQVDLELPPEYPDDPPGAPAVSRHTPAASPSFGRFTSIQVNVNGSGANIVEDAANEPSIAVDPFDHNRMAIGWRQFDTIRSNFRQAGFAYSTNGGLNWMAGKIQPGVFRSDPVLGVDSDGDFFFLSLDSDFNTQLFPSINHGMTWGAPVLSDGGDKPWMTIDRTSGPGQNHIYQAWSVGGFSNIPNFNRSNDGGMSFLSPSLVPNAPRFGTLDVAADGTLFIVGVNNAEPGIAVARSTDAQGGLANPTFVMAYPNLGGSLRGSVSPNPEGLLGQLWLAVDRSTGPHAGWIYVLASVATATDPLDVHFIRSSDGGATWSTPIRVNDDPAGTGAHQWFGTMSVSPDGRIDAVWNDTRGSSDITVSALYYSCSTDGGATWSDNEQASPTWNSMLGFPKQRKIGDYYHMISDSSGADLAYAATFNNEQDVYYLRITPPPVAADFG